MKSPTEQSRPYTLEHCFISRPEKLIAAAVFLVLTAVLGFAMTVRVYMHQGDSAMFIELVANTVRHGLPLTQINAAINDAASTWTAPVDQVCSGDLTIQHHPYPNDSINQFTRHAYLVAYPLSILTLLAPAVVILPFAQAAAFVGMLAVVYFLLRRYGVGAIGAAIFTAAVGCHPVWDQGLIGNLYADRYFLLLGLVYIAVLYGVLMEAGAGFTPTRLGLVIALGLLAASVNERAALMVGSATIAIVLLYGPRFSGRGYRSGLIAFGLTLIAGFVAYMALYSENPDFRNFAMSGMTNPIFAILGVSTWSGTNSHLLDGTGSFLLVNGVIFGALSILNWRLALIAAGAMLPNLMFSIGNKAEKTVWVTHYHSYYFPFLVFATLLGFRALWIHSSRLQRVAISLGGAGIAVILALVPGSEPMTFRLANFHTTAWFQAYEILTQGKDSSWRFFADLKTDVAARIPHGSIVMTNEDTMVVLSGDRKITYFPIGMEQADYAVLQMAKAADGREYFVPVTASGEVERLGLCLTDRMRREGWDVDNVQKINQFYWIVRHVHSPA